MQLYIQSLTVIVSFALVTTGSLESGSIVGEGRFSRIQGVTESNPRSQSGSDSTKFPNRPVPIGRSSLNSYIPAACGIRQLEKRNPWADNSDVVHPIVYYIDPNTPKVWVPYLKRGIEAWNSVFASIGFQNAIVAQELPIAGRDSIWSELDDGQHDVVEWITDSNVDDLTAAETNPRCSDGIMTAAPILINESVVMKWIPRLEFYSAITADSGNSSNTNHKLLVQCPASDSAAGKRATCPLSQEAIGLAIQAIMTHEMGHSIGLDHNFAGRWTYPTDSLRSLAFVQRMGITPTIMDYGFINYVAQPADRMPLQMLIKQISVYDRWAISWLYRPIPGAFTLEQEKPTLQQWASAQDTATYLRGSTEGINEGLEKMVVIGGDHVKAAEYSLRNMARVANMFDVHQDSLLTLWNHQLDNGNFPLNNGGSASEHRQDSSQAVTVVRFDADHIMLGRDSIFNIVGLTSTDALPGWDLASWQQERERRTDGLLELMKKLVSPRSSIGIRTGVCHVISATSNKLASSAMLASANPPARQYAESTRVKLNAIAQESCKNI